ncbi:MAG: hypothetical protein KKA52_01460 [Candidatus Omnitrophica bacterium]|nr:hypothetical protein [Candidatus Omnitrophota bacterium]
MIRNKLPILILGIIVFFISSYFSDFKIFCAQEEEEEEDDDLIAKFEQILESRPNDEKAQGQLAVLYHNRAMELANYAEWEKAIEYEEQAYKLNPQEKVITKSLSVLHNALGLEMKDQKKYRGSLQCLNTALEYAPDEAQVKKNIAVVYLELAYEAFDRNEYMNCRDYLRQAKDHNPDNPFIYVLSGQVAANLDDPFQAERDWNQALELDPNLYQTKLSLEKLKKDKDVESSFSIKEVGNFKLKFEGLEKQDLAQTAAEALKDAYREVGQDFNIFPQSVVPVIIYPAPALEEGHYFPDWAAGAYDGKIRIGENLGKRELDLKAVLFHEYTHVIVHIIAGPRVPLWFNEGLAEHEANRFKQTTQKKARNQMLHRAIRKGIEFAVEELAQTDLTRMSYLSPSRIELVYAQSESFVTYLIDKSSLHDMKMILERLNRGETIQKAIKNVLYMDLEALERNWKNKFKEE